jgi:hypothetical protein
VPLVLSQYVDQLALVEDKHPVQALSSNRANPSLGVRVALGRSRRAAQYVDTGSSEFSIERSSELGVTITD